MQAVLSKTHEALIGRDGELDLLRSFLDRAAIDGEALLLWGEPGVGKTALLDAATEAASSAGTRVLRAAGAEFETEVAFSGLNQLFLPLQHELEKLSDTQHSALSVALGFLDGQPAERLVVSTAALRLLRMAGAAEPMLMIVDDVQWLDRSSAAVLSFVVRRLAGSRLGFLVAARTAPESHFDHRGVPVLDVRRLDDAASADLVGARFPTLAPQVRRRVLAEAEGNPLALLELPAAMSDPQRNATVALPAVLPLDRRLQTLFASRISDLPARTRQALLLGALEGKADLGVLSATAEQLDLDDLAAAEHAGLIRVDEGSRRLDFRHPLIPAAVVELSTAGERRRAHRALAEALSDQPERRAWHLAEASVGPDEDVAGLLQQAARRILRRGDSVGAVAALLSAADLSPHGSDRARRLAEAAYVGAAVTGELSSVSRRLVDARRADPDGGESLGAAVAAAHLLLSGEGDVDTAHRLLVGAIETQAGAYDAEDQALTEALHALMIVCHYGGGRVELWAPFHSAMAQLQPRAPVVLALCSTLYADPARSTPAQLDRLDSVISRLHDEVDPARIVRVAMAASNMDRLTSCRLALWRVVDDGREGGAVASAISALLPLCFDDIQIGRWSDGLKLADEGLALCESYGYHMQAWLFRLGKAQIAARLGDNQATETLTAELLQWAEPRGILLVRPYARHARALAALGRGDYEEAYEQASAISPPGNFAPYVPLAMWAMMDLVEAAVHTGRRAEAAAHVAATHEANIADLSPRLALLAGGAAAIAATSHDANDLFDEVLAIPSVARWPFDVARVRLAYGEHLRRAGAIGASREELAAAFDAFENLGARPWATRAAGELRASGVDTQRPDELSPSSLTAQETEIATLAATGLTNKEIGQRLYLSHRTIGAHLYRIFPKLGIKSRAALADALRALQ
jgi:DNA-binding CsgD family transcriptional regulator